MNSNIRLDQIDLEILQLLQIDADQTLSQIGGVVGLSGPAVLRRIQRYRRNKIIQRTAAHLDPDQVGGFLTILNLATLERDTGPKVDRLRKRMERSEHVQQCYELAGSFDLATIFVVPDMGTYRRVANELLGKDSNVRRFVTHVSLDTIKATLRIPV